MTCAFPNCKSHAQPNLFCIGHKDFAEPSPPKPFKPIAHYSKKRVKENSKLGKIVDRMKIERPFCEMRVPGICTGKTQTAHHPYGRIGDHLLNEDELIPSCYACNSWEVSHSKEAKEMGISFSRLAK